MPSREIAIVLVRTHTPGNLGSAARVSKNFGVRDIRLVEPAAEPDEESARLASGADDLLASIRRTPDLREAVADFDAVVATSSLRGRQPQRFLELNELPGFLAELGAAPADAPARGAAGRGSAYRRRSDPAWGTRRG